MNLGQFAWKSLIYYWRNNLAVAAGICAATAVLTGALIVGDSMRGSLLRLTTERLGKIDELIVAEGFFSVELVEQIKALPEFNRHYDDAQPLILFPSVSVVSRLESSQTGTTPTESGLIKANQRRASEVTLMGVTKEFSNLSQDKGWEIRSLSGSQVIINQALADQLNISPEGVNQGSARLTIRVPKQSLLPGDSPMSKQDDLVESLVDLQLVQIVPNSGLGRFSLHPSQADPLNVYLSLDFLQEALEPTVLKHKPDNRQANVILLAGVGGRIPEEGIGASLLQTSRPSLDDFGLSLRRVSREFAAAPRSKKGQTRSGDSSSKEQAALRTELKDQDLVAQPAPEIIFDYWSLSTDRLVFTDSAADLIQATFPEAKPVFTYLINDLRLSSVHEKGDRSPANGIPFSMVSAIDFDTNFSPISAVSGEPITPLQADEIVLVEWAANDLGLSLNDRLTLTFFEPETTHGQQVEQSREFTLIDIAELTEPIESYSVPRRGPIRPSQFDQRPQITNDPDLTPEVPGITDAESIDRWDLPFETASRIRSQDDQYWNDHRTTPKGFVGLQPGQELWNSRYGKVTNFRIQRTSFDEKSVDQERQMILERLTPQLTEHAGQFGFQLVPIKRRGLTAATGSTPFDILFLALSMFVIGSALILVALLFRLAFQQRASEVGCLSATGFSSRRIRQVWLLEMSLVSLLGGMGGIVIGIGYASLLILGLSTWWVGAISRPFLQLELTPITLIVGLISGAVIGVITIAWSLRSALRGSTRQLLSGHSESEPSDSSKPWKSQNSFWRQLVNQHAIFIAVLITMALGLTWLAVGLSGESQAGAFMGAGFLILIAGLMAVHRTLKHQPKQSVELGIDISVVKLAWTNSRRNPLRSTLTIGLVAVASFLIAAVSSFRLSPTVQGTAGFDWVARSSQPILVDLSTSSGRERALGSEVEMDADTTVIPLRLQAGEDASCNNLFQSTQPQILGIPDQMVEYFNPTAAGATSPFAWAGSLAQTEQEKRNPWNLLSTKSIANGTADDPIPAVIDKNTANYSLKIYQLGALFPVQYDDGRTIHFKVVGFLNNTVLQGSLLIGEREFLNAFPEVSGYRFFLIRDGDPMTGDRLASQSNNKTILEERLSDYGFFATSATHLLGNFMRVQNTYLSTFQTLGALGLMLGTIGLAAVQWRSILERRKELGLMRAVGFSQQRLRYLILLENIFLLLTGLGVGIAAALFTTLPHGLLGQASIPWIDLGIMFAIIIAVGIIASRIASKQVFRLQLLQSLRD